MRYEVFESMKKPNLSILESGKTLLTLWTMKYKIPASHLYS